MRSDHSKAGYTLVELMVTVSLVGILAGLSIVSFGRNWRAERLKAATRETTAWLDEARRIAIQKAKPCRININRADILLSLNPNTDNPKEFCPDTLYRPLDIRNTVQNSSEIVMCSTDLVNADPAQTSLACTGSQSGSSSLTYTPRGTATKGVLIKFHMPDAGADRCIAVIAPLGQIRSGKTTATGCDFTTAF